MQEIEIRRMSEDSHRPHPEPVMPMPRRVPVGAARAEVINADEWAGRTWSSAQETMPGRGQAPKGR